MRHVWSEGKPDFDAYTSGRLAGATSFLLFLLWPTVKVPKEMWRRNPKQSRSSGKEAVGSWSPASGSGLVWGPQHSFG